MTDDSGRRRARDLADALQVAAVIGALVDLGLPWFRHYDSERDAVITSSGWRALGDSTEGYPWFVIGVVLIGVAAVVLDRWWMRRAAAWVASLVALGMWFGLSNVNRLDDYHALPGAWTGMLVVAACAVAQWSALLALPGRPVRG
ncbi:hypothetical protein ACVW00_001111 [Marmoricola sp. URHA0025 HA25]